MSKKAKEDLTNRKRAERLVNIRNENNFSQDYVAENVGMSKKNYQKYEYAERWIHRESLEPFIEFYKKEGVVYSAEYLLCYTDIKEPNTELNIRGNKKDSEMIKHLIKTIELLCGDEFIINYQYIFHTEEEKEKARQNTINKYKMIMSVTDTEWARKRYDEIKRKLDNDDIELEFETMGTTIDNIIGLDFSSPVCKVKEKDTEKEIVVTGATFKDGGVFYGGLSHIIETITVLIKNYFEDFAFNSESTNEIYNLNQNVHDIIECSKEIDLNDEDYKEQFIYNSEMVFKKNNEYYENVGWKHTKDLFEEYKKNNKDVSSNEQ